MRSIPVRHIKGEQAGSKLINNFSIRRLQDLMSDGDMMECLHRHDFYYLLLIEHGQGIHEIDFLPYEISDHCIFIMRPGQVHQLQLSAGTRGYLMQFNSNFYSPVDKKAIARFRGASVVNHYQVGDESFDKLCFLLNYIYKEIDEKRDEYESVINAQLSIFFIELIRESVSKLSGHITMHTQERLERFLELLEVNIFKHKQVTDYSEMMNLSVYQLNKITKTALNKTCSELIDEQILLESKRCLLATPHQVTQIGYYMGYEDVSYFTRFFKKHTGYSPEAFRQKFR